MKIGAHIGSIPKTPWVFLGLGLYRAWIEMVFVGPWIDFPVFDFAGQNMFDLAMTVVLIACALFSKRIAPLYRKHKTLACAAASMCFGTVLLYATLLRPDTAAFLALPATIAGGAGVAFIILIWSELYACINPFKVALYFAESILVCAVVIFICKGFIVDYLCAISILLPILTLGCALKAFSTIPESDLPSPDSSKRIFPWKPVLLMAVYAFAYGLRENEVLASTGPMSGIGVIIAAAAVLLGLFFKGRDFNLDIAYRISLPAMICAFALVPIIGPQGGMVTSACASLSYTAYSIYIMILMSSISRRFGVCAIFLFGLERGIRALFTLLGRLTSSALDAITPPDFSHITITCMVIVLIATCAMLLMSERNLNSQWGITFKQNNDQKETADAHEKTLHMRCAEIASQYSLTAREEEVLLLLAKRMSISEIERELFIANGTAKAHVRHIYEKLDIHNRNALFKLVGIDSD